MQRFKDHLRIAWAGKQIQYSPTYDLAKRKKKGNKKVFIFRQGNCTMNVLHSSLSKSFALSICSRDPMKNSTLEYFFQGYVQPNAPQVATMIAVWKIIIVFRSSSWNFSSPHYVTYFVRQYLQTVMEKVTS